jgi:hypothetical protein
MKNLILTLVLLASGISFSQDTTEVYSEMLSYRAQLQKEEQLRPTYKTGDNDELVRGLYKTLFTDDVTPTILMNHPTLQDLYVSSTVQGEGVTVKIPFIQWVNENIINSSYRNNDNFYIKFVEHDNIEQICFMNSDDKMERVIIIKWDTTHDGVNHTNLRFIEDSDLNQSDVYGSIN